MFPQWANPADFTLQVALEYQGRSHNNGLIAVSPHYVGIFAQERATYAKLLFFHILTLKELSVHRDSVVMTALSGGSVRVLVRSADLVRILYRNSAFATFLVPKAMKLSVSLFDQSLLPPFPVPLSLSQVLQFRFAALCSQSELSYDHSAIEYVHSLLIDADPILDLTRVAAAYHVPLIQSFGDFFPLVGLSASREKTIGGAVAGCIDCLRFLSIDKCPAAELTRALRSGAHLTHLAIANCELDDPEPLLRAVGQLKTQLLHFSISGTPMGTRATEILPQMLCENRVFASLEHLGIGGVKLSAKGVALLSRYVRQNDGLVSLDLSGSAQFAGVLQAIGESSIIILSCALCEFDDASAVALIKVAPSLVSLDLRSSNLRVLEIGEAIGVLGRDRSKGLTIKLNGIDLSEKNVVPLLKGFLLSDLEKWTEIQMNRTKINSFELAALHALFMRMPKLTALSLECNFGEEDALVVGRLLEIPSLKSLNLASSKLRSLVPKLAASSLTSLNLSGNDLGDDDVVALISGRNEWEVLALSDNPLKNVQNLASLGRGKLTRGIFANWETECPDLVGEFQKVLARYNLRQHSCVCEDFGLPLPVGSDCRKQTVALIDAAIYSLPHLNELAIEPGFEPRGISPICELSQVGGEKDHSSDSLDAFMSPGLIPNLNEPMLGGGISDDSGKEEEAEDAELLELMKSRIITPSDLTNSVLPDQVSSDSDQDDRQIETKASKRVPAPDLDHSEFDSTAPLPTPPPPPPQAGRKLRMLGTIVEESMGSLASMIPRKRIPAPSARSADRRKKGGRIPVPAGVIASMNEGKLPRQSALAFSPPSLVSKKKHG
jgi:Leucine-rich repeat (LRR) protein